MASSWSMIRILFIHDSNESRHRGSPSTCLGEAQLRGGHGRRRARRASSSRAEGCENLPLRRPCLGVGLSPRCFTSTMSPAVGASVVEPAASSQDLADDDAHPDRRVLEFRLILRVSSAGTIPRTSPFDSGVAGPGVFAGAASSRGALRPARRHGDLAAVAKDGESPCVPGGFAEMVRTSRSPSSIPLTRDRL